MSTATYRWIELGGFLTLERGWCSVWRKEWNIRGRWHPEYNDLYLSSPGAEKDTTGTPLGLRGHAPIGAIIDFGGWEENRPWAVPMDEPDPAPEPALEGARCVNGCGERYNEVGLCPTCHRTSTLFATARTED